MNKIFRKVINRIKNKTLFITLKHKFKKIFLIKNNIIRNLQYEDEEYRKCTKAC